MGANRAALKIGATLDGKSLVVNIANDMRLRLQDNVSALNRALDSSVHNHSFGCDSSGDMSLTRDNERSAVQLAFDLPIDLH
jgi:hypothetical protein